MSRADVFNNIRRGLGRQQPTQAQRDAVAKRLTERPTSTIPARGQGSAEQQCAVFKAMALEASAEIIEIRDYAELGDAVTTRLAAQNIAHLVSASDPELTAIDWSQAKNLTVEQRVALAGDLASLTTSFAAIAETGTLMLHSGSSSPTTLNFLPDLHIVVLKQSSIVGYYEQAWQLIRDKFGEQLPRTVNMITGPSRSADIEQKLQMGAHGPRELVIILMTEL